MPSADKQGLTGAAPAEPGADHECPSAAPDAGRTAHATPVSDLEWSR